MEPPAKLHKEASSQQLFVLLEEDVDAEAPQQPAEDSPPQGSPAALPGRRLCGGWRDARLVAAAVALLLAAQLAALALAARFGRGGLSRRQLLPAEQKSVFGSLRLPERLPPPPAPQILTHGHPAYHCTYGVARSCPARELLANPELHEVATENLMQVGRGILVAADRDAVRATVAAGFRNLSRQLDTRAPAAARALAQLELSRAQKDAVLSSLRLASLPKVQRVGFEVSLAIRQSVSLRRGVIRRHVEDMLRSNIKEIEGLRDEVIPPSLLAFWDTSHQWEMTLEPENIQVMEAFHGGKFFGSMNASFYATFLPTLPKKLPTEEKMYGVWSGVLEEGKVVLNTIKLISRSRGLELDLPASTTSLSDNIDVKDLGSEVLSCELHEGSSMNNLMKAFFCPLKYGSQGIDALRAASSMARLRGNSA